MRNIATAVKLSKQRYGVWSQFLDGIGTFFSGKCREISKISEFCRVIKHAAVEKRWEVLMESFQSVNKILIGDQHIAELFRGAGKVFVVCDPFIVQSDTIRYVTDELEQLKIQYEVFSEIKPDPGTELIAKGISKIRDIGPDMVVAFGGGSAIDAGKAMVYFAKLQKYMEDCIFVAIPTTSGTGSEVTKFSVITDTEKSIKYPLIDDSILPDYAVLDAHLTLTVPPAITADTGMDVLTHAIEALVSVDANDFTDAVAEKAIKLVRSNLMKAYKEPDNLEARQAMHNASCLAGLAFSNAGLGLNHGMAHALGAHFHIPHGRANAVLLPYVIAYNAGCFDHLTDVAKSYAKIARLIHVDASSIRQSGLNLIRTVKTFIEKLCIPSTIQGLGIEKEAFLAALPDMVEAAVNDSCTGTNPRACSREDIERVYLHAYSGKMSTR